MDQKPASSALGSVVTTVAVIAAIVEAGLVISYKTKLEALERLHAKAAEAPAALQPGRSVKSATVARINDADATNPKREADSDLVKTLLTRTDQLHTLLEEHPEMKIPEMSLLTEQDYLEAALTADLNSEYDQRIAYSSLRTAAKKRFLPVLRAALKQYESGHDGQLPTTVDAVQNALPGVIDPSVTSRYTMAQSGSQAARQGWQVTEIAPVDPDHDTMFNISMTGYSYSTIDPVANGYQAALTSYQNAHNGEAPKSNRDLLPFFPASVRDEIADELGLDAK
jgi:hypothetical protein